MACLMEVGVPVRACFMEVGVSVGSGTVCLIKRESGFFVNQ